MGVTDKLVLDDLDGDLEGERELLPRGPGDLEDDRSKFLFWEEADDWLFREDTDPELSALSVLIFGKIR